MLPKGISASLAVSLALNGQPGVDAPDVLVQERVEAAGPSLFDAVRFQCGNQFRRVIERQSAGGPAGEVEVGVDHGRSQRPIRMSALGHFSVGSNPADSRPVGPVSYDIMPSGCVTLIPT